MNKQVQEEIDRLDADRSEDCIASITLKNGDALTIRAMNSESVNFIGQCKENNPFFAVSSIDQVAYWIPREEIRYIKIRQAGPSDLLKTR